MKRDTALAKFMVISRQVSPASPPDVCWLFPELWGINQE
jgi:hypothetical protein